MNFSEYVLNEGRILDFLKKQFFNPNSSDIRELADKSLDSIAKSKLLQLFYYLNLLSVTLGNSMPNILKVLKGANADMSSLETNLKYGIPSAFEKSLKRILPNPRQTIKEFIQKHLCSNSFEIGESKSGGITYPSESDLTLFINVRGDFSGIKENTLKGEFERILSSNFKTSKTLGQDTIKELEKFVDDDEKFTLGVGSPQFRDMIELEIFDSVKLECEIRIAGYYR